MEKTDMKFEEESVHSDGNSPSAAPDRIIKRRKKRSSAWELVSVKEGTTYCLQCGVVLSVTSTTNFERHYIRHHKETWKKWKERRIFLQNLEKAKDDDLFDRHLIETVQFFPVLHTLAIGELGIQNAVWSEISDKVNHRGFNSSAETCQKRWNMLKDLFLAEHARKLSNPLSASFESAWPLYDAMLFLEPYLEESLGHSSIILNSHADAEVFGTAGPSSIDATLIGNPTTNDFSQIPSCSLQNFSVTPGMENGESRCYDNAISGDIAKKHRSPDAGDARKLSGSLGMANSCLLQQPMSSCGFRHEGNIVVNPGSREGHLLSMLTGLVQTLSDAENKELVDSLVLHACEKYAEICRNRKEPQQS